MKTKIIAWNVNGVRAVTKKVDLNNYLQINKPDLFFMSETKLSLPDNAFQEEFLEKIDGYKYRYFHTCERKKGYSGTALLANKKPLKVYFGIGVNVKEIEKDGNKIFKDEFDDEGRVITAEYKDFAVVHVYTPNSGQNDLKRLPYRVNTWDKKFWEYVGSIKKEVIVCGDLNCAPYEIDVFSPKTKKKSAGFTKEERESLIEHTNKLKLVDIIRQKHPEKDYYSYWTYMRQAREKNNGWRIDHYWVTEKIAKKVKEANIHTKYLGSDHAPIELVF